VYTVEGFGRGEIFVRFSQPFESQLIHQRN
jgi:hypothetical protein